MKDGKYKVLRLTTVRSGPNAFAIGTLYQGDTFEVLHVPTSGKYKDSVAWGYARGVHFKGWCWMPLVDKRKQRKLADQPYAAASHTWSRGGGGRVSPQTFAKNFNKAPLNDGAQTHIERLPSGKSTFLRGNRNRKSPKDVRLGNGATVKWRYVTRDNPELVMVRHPASSRWGFVPRKYLPAVLPHS